MANLPSLKGVRTRYRNVLESEIKSGNDVLNYKSIDDDFETKLNQAAVCVKKLTDYQTKLETQSEKLCAALGDVEGDVIERIIQEDCDLNEAACEMCVLVQRHVDNLTLRNKEKDAGIKEEIQENVSLNEIVRNMQEIMVSQQRDSNQRSENKTNNNVRLPKIDLISFDGEKTKWPEFWDSFESSVNSNTSLTNIDKFNYLKSKLFGSARKSISGLSLTNGNYDVAIKILKERFGNEQDVIKIHYDRLINLHAATNKVSSLRALLDAVDQHLRSLEVLGQDVNQSVFVSMIWSKIPEDVLMQLQMKNGVDRKWTVFALRNALNEYVVARERTEKKSFPDKSWENQKAQETRKVYSNSATGYSKGSNSYGFKPPSCALVVEPYSRKQVIHKPESYRNKCRYCAKAHWSDQCPSFRSVNERKAKLQNSCFRCLKEGHRSDECKLTKKCFYCGEQNSHHRSLCPQKFKPKSTMAHAVNENVHTQESEIQSSQQNESALLSANEVVLMQTALTTVTNLQASKSTETRLFLDSGSQRTYITERLCTELGLTVSDSDTLNVVTFGSAKPQSIKTKSTKLNIKLKNGDMLKITANVVPLISSDIHRQPVKSLQKKEMLQLLQSVVLADTLPSKGENSSIEFLIGNDFYLDLILGQKVELQPGLYLLSSKLGWILSGRSNEYQQCDNDVNMFVMTPGSVALTSNCTQQCDPEIKCKPNIDDFWNVEALGITDDDVNTDDVIANENFNKTLMF